MANKNQIKPALSKKNHYEIKNFWCGGGPKSYPII